MSRINRSFALLSAGMALLAACEDVTQPTEPLAPREKPTAAASAQEEGEYRPHEAHFHKVAAELKSFGGYHYDEAGNLIVHLADPGEEGRAKELLSPVLEERLVNERQRGGGELIVVKAEYTFSQLAGWRDRTVDQVLDAEGAHYVDLDEALNRLTVGVSDSRAREHAAEVLAEHRVPLEAVVFEETKGVEPDLTLQDFFRPLQGGFQIASSGGICTLGFNATLGETRGFLTNSHCTPTFWGYDGVAVYQNVVAAGRLAGYEFRDPGTTSCGFLGLYRCRWSDASFIRLASGVSADHGYIARTTFWATGVGNSGSLTIDPNRPRMRITGEYPFPVGGEMFDKMGRTTGWTYGFVHKTCVDHSKGGNRRIRCQDWNRNLHRGGGDSGSPIFRWHGDTVTLAGLHWGSIVSGGRRYAIMSAMWNIEHDIGALDTF